MTWYYICNKLTQHTVYANYFELSVMWVINNAARIFWILVHAQRTMQWLLTLILVG